MRMTTDGKEEENHKRDERKRDENDHSRFQTPSTRNAVIVDGWEERVVSLVI